MEPRSARRATLARSLSRARRELPFAAMPLLSTAVAPRAPRENLVLGLDQRPSQQFGSPRDQPLLPLPSASSATALDFLSTGIQTSLPAPRDERDSIERRYTRAVLGRYLWLPDTPTQISRHDRRLAVSWFEDGVALLDVEAALLLAATRRALREPWRTPLPRVRALHYYLPVVAEILDDARKPDLEYLTCLLRRLRPLAEIKWARLQHQATYGGNG